jgi:hypothetical protein
MKNILSAAADKGVAPGQFASAGSPAPRYMAKLMKCGRLS